MLHNAGVPLYSGFNCTLSCCLQIFLSPGELPATSRWQVFAQSAKCCRWQRPMSIACTLLVLESETKTNNKKNTQRQTPRKLHKHTQKVGKCRPPSAPSLWQRPMSGAGAMLCWSHAEYSKSQLTRHLGNFEKVNFFVFTNFHSGG